MSSELTKAKMWSKGDAKEVGKGVVDGAHDLDLPISPTCALVAPVKIQIIRWIILTMSTMKYIYG